MDTHLNIPKVLSSEDLAQDQLFKVIIIGDSGVGKSCLMKRVTDDDFDGEEQVTVGVKFSHFDVYHGDRCIKL